MTLQSWSWIFLAVYVAGMLLLGYIGSRRVHNADDFATARGGYGPVFLALAYTSTVASGATFLGLPALAYSFGMSTMWYLFSYPIGVYVGVLICQRIIVSTGNSFGSRTIPEFLGDMYDSDALRTLSAIYSLILIFYLAGQLVAGVVVFELMLGVDAIWALSITSLVLLVYVSLGGAHADILTDGVQAVLMLILALMVAYFFVTGYGVQGGYDGMIERITALDSDLVATFSSNTTLYNSIGAVLAIILASVLTGMMPHAANKLWALKNESARSRFIAFSFVFGMTLPAIGLAGILARAIVGDALLADGMSPNSAVPVLFIELFPAWLAALVSVGVLAAVMSTADGLVVSTSQIFANDIFRRSIAPRYAKFDNPQVADKWALTIGRIGTIATVFFGMAVAWYTMDKNIALLVWIGLGGLTAAIAGPLLVGAFWRKVTKAGAITGFIGGAVTFGILHSGIIPAPADPTSMIGTLALWLRNQAPNPFVCATIADAVSILLTIGVSLVTRPPSDEHLDRIFPAKIRPV